MGRALHLQYRSLIPGESWFRRIWELQPIPSFAFVASPQRCGKNPRRGDCGPDMHLEKLPRRIANPGATRSRYRRMKGSNLMYSDRKQLQCKKLTFPGVPPPAPMKVSLTGCSRPGLGLPKMSSRLGRAGPVQKAQPLRASTSVQGLGRVIGA